MGSSILRSLCLNTDWKYAVFWKPKHRAPMVLTLEDAYYDNHGQHDPSQNNLHGGDYSHDPLGLAVAKMSYHVYSLGEGIVGEVAVSGKHQWIFADKHVNSSCSSFEFFDGWQSQFEAGIRTIAVVAVAPHGVVQLGSLKKVFEDVKLVSNIRDVFFALQDSSLGHIPANPLECGTKSSVFEPELRTKLLDTEVISLGKAVDKEGTDFLLPEFAQRRNISNGTFVFPLSGNHQKRAVELKNKPEGLEPSSAGSDESAKLLTPGSNVSNLEQLNHLRNLINNGVCKGETSGWKSSSTGPENVYKNHPVVASTNLFNVAFQAELSGADHTFCSNTSSKFSAGYELYEALGPAFVRKSIYTDWQVENMEAGANMEMLEAMSSSQLTSEYGSENLLEAVVANVCHSGSDIKSERSSCRPAPSSVTTGNAPELSSQTKHTISSAGDSINRSLVENNAQQHLKSSTLCGAMSSKGFYSASPSPSNCSEQLERSSEPAKNSKKRARPGENPRPRPRDRQLIQDRIKELRELVPSGTKCSIDSLLERTIKHMVFLQGITKHADKLSKCAESKMHHKGPGMLGPTSYEQGSSWAVEVGSHLKVCSIVVENINKNGQMLVELLCEECSHFLEIAEAIKSLGLTILKGVTEARDEKTWICFVVEGQNNRVMHRMDILWSLVQILQSKATS